MQCLGKVGTVKHLYSTGDVVITMAGNLWAFNPLCLIPAPGQVPDVGGGGGAGGGGGGGGGSDSTSKATCTVLCDSCSFMQLVV